MSGWNEDPAQWASVAAPDMAQEIDQLEDEFCERFGVTQKQAAEIAQWYEKHIEQEVAHRIALFLGRVIGVLLKPGNVRLRACGLAFATGLGALNGCRSQRETARDLGVTPAAVSKVVKEWADLLELSPSPHMKSAEACRRYSEIQTQRHWRRNRRLPQLTRKETTP